MFGVLVPFVFFFVFIFFFLFFIGFDLIFPLPDFVTEKKTVKAVTAADGTAADGRPLRFFPDVEGIWRYRVDPDQISPDYLKMLIHYEDRWFYWHLGVNPLSLLRAWQQNRSSGRIISGGSTLTMQVARLIDPHERSYLGKLKQIFRALQLELHYSKAEILGFYLNYAPFGGVVEGVLTASYAYFNKPAEYLSLAEATLLTVIPQSPSRFRPDRRPEAARNKVLARMGEMNLFDQKDLVEAMGEPILANCLHHDYRAPHLAERLVRRYPDRDVIKSTIDYSLQVELEERVRDYLLPYPEEISAAVLVIDHADFQVKAYVGTADYTSIPKRGYVDMVEAVRSPGSTLKPFLYGLALDEGLIHSASLLSDVPQYFGDYHPLNFDRTFQGPVTAAAALQESLNIPAVQVMEAYGPEEFYSAMENAGIDLRLLHGDKPNLSLILGGTGITLEELVVGFAAFGNLGFSGELRMTGEEELRRYRLLSPGAAWIARRIMEEIPIQPRNSYFGQAGANIAWKTGTSYGYRDSWVLASTPRYTLGLWVGRADGNYVIGNTSQAMALPLMRNILSSLEFVGFVGDAKLGKLGGARDEARDEFKDEIRDEPPQPELNNLPDSVTVADICWPSGRRQELEDPANCHVTKKAYLLRGMAPPTLPPPGRKNWAFREREIMVSEFGKRIPPGCQIASQNFNKSPEGKAVIQKKTLKKILLWPKLLEPWVLDAWKPENLIPPIDLHCRESLVLEPNPNQIQIVSLSPLDHSLRPVYGQDKVVLTLKALGSRGKAHWFVNHRWIKSAAAEEEVIIVLD